MEYIQKKTENNLNLQCGCQLCSVFRPTLITGIPGRQSKTELENEHINAYEVKYGRKPRGIGVIGCIASLNAEDLGYAMFWTVSFFNYL
nr:hypothetical protein [Haliscomenobacter sp.]